MSDRKSRTARAGVDTSDTFYPLVAGWSCHPPFPAQKGSLPQRIWKFICHIFHAPQPSVLSCSGLKGNSGDDTRRSASPQGSVPGAHLLDNGGGGAVLHQAQHAHLAAIGTDDIELG